MENEKLNRPVCLISGGSSGIGLSTAQIFASRGYDISICGRREAKLAEAKGLILDINPSVDCLIVQADFEDIQQAQSFATQTIERFGRVDVLVNNAAVSVLAPFGEMTSDAFESAMNVNMRSLFYLTQRIWNQMMKQGTGVIVNISSLSAVDPFPGLSLYGASKAWLDLLTHALAAESQDAGLRVCSIRPGAVETPMLRGLFPDFPADQCVQPGDIAKAVWDCVNDPESFPSGQAFTITK